MVGRLWILQFSCGILVSFLKKKKKQIPKFLLLPLSCVLKISERTKEIVKRAMSGPVSGAKASKDQILHQKVAKLDRILPPYALLDYLSVFLSNRGTLN